MNDQYQIDVLEDKILETVGNYVEKNVKRPFGIFLSGGFDSGLLAAITKPDFVFSVRFPYGIKYDESRYADAIIKHLGLQSKTTIITPTKEDFEKYFPEAVKAMGEPVPHFSLVPLYIAMKMVADRVEETKCVDILSGEGPDEYLGGYARQIIFDELKKLYEIPELRNYHGMIEKVTGTNLVRQYGEMMGYPSDLIEKYTIDFYENGYPLQGAIGKMDMELGVIEKMEQKLAKANGINLHYPYINEGFAEYCYKLADDLKIRDGVTKWAFRQICKKYLPEFIMDRAKMGGPVFPVNLQMDWMKNGEFNKTRYILEQERILGLDEKSK